MTPLCNPWKLKKSGIAECQSNQITELQQGRTFCAICRFSETALSDAINFLWLSNKQKMCFRATCTPKQ